MAGSGRLSTAFPPAPFTLHPRTSSCSPRYALITFGSSLTCSVGPSATPPPPCDALDLAQSTGKFPPWPTKGFATTGWKQVFARERAAGPAPEDMCPTATAGPAARSAPSYCPGAGSGPSAGPAYSPAASTSRPGKTDPPGWAILAGLALLAALAFKLKRRKP